MCVKKSIINSIYLIAYIIVILSFRHIRKNYKVIVQHSVEIKSTHATRESEKSPGTTRVFPKSQQNPANQVKGRHS